MGNEGEKIRPYIETKGMVPLKDLLPLSVPYSILIDPANACNFKCTFCPTGDKDLLRSVNRPKGMMTLELFRKIVDDIAALEREAGRHVAKIHLYKDGEPLLNKDLGRMIAYVKSKGLPASLEVTTNGALLTADRVREIVDAGIDVVRVSIEHVTAEGYKKITQTYSDYEAIKRNVAAVFAYKQERRPSMRVHCKTLDTGFTPAERAKFMVDFEPICDTIHIDRLMGWSMSDEKDFTLGAEVKTGVYEGKLIKRQVCPEPFSKMVVNFNGEVSVCCVDWSHGTVVGDLNTQSVSSVWNGGPLRAFRIKHLQGRRDEIKACANCQYLDGLPEHTLLDPSAADLLKKYSK